MAALGTFTFLVGPFHRLPQISVSHIHSRYLNHDGSTVAPLPQTVLPAIRARFSRMAPKAVAKGLDGTGVAVYASL